MNKILNYALPLMLALICIGITLWMIDLAYNTQSGRQALRCEHDQGTVVWIECPALYALGQKQPPECGQTYCQHPNGTRTPIQNYAQKEDYTS